MRKINTIACLFPLTALCSLGAPSVERSADAAALSAFGYDNPRNWINQTPPRGHRPLLVVLIQVDGKPEFDANHSLTFYDTNIFNLLSTQSMSGYFLENSKGRFYWERAGPGTIGPIPLPASESFDETLKRAGKDLVDLLYHSNLVARTMTSGRIDLQQFDDNANGVVTRDELCMLFIANEGGPGAAGARFPGPVRPDDFLYTVDLGAVAIVQWRSGFSIVAHELSHLLGAWDLYATSGNQSGGLTTMATSSGAEDSRETFHLDPFHKLQFGWYNGDDSAIQLLHDGGVRVLHAASTANADPPLILYDPARGTHEFFIVEYRTKSWPTGTTYERELPEDGVVIWHVQKNANHEPLVVTWFEAGLIPGQNLWRFCGKCKGLHFIANDGSPVLGKCPKGDFHSRDGSKPYLVVNNNPSAPGQSGWRWCHKCKGLFFGPNQSLSHCPVDGTHDGSQGGNYTVMQNDVQAPGQSGWRWCNKCQGMFHGPDQKDSDCPADDEPHDGSGSGNYSILMEGSVRAVRSLGAPGLQPGRNAVWGSGSTTPYLQWADGTPTRTRVHVRPFSPTDGSVVVEWRRETWVDFKHIGAEFGSFADPFNSLEEGVFYSPWGGYIKLKPGSSKETMLINKHLHLEVVDGAATIGRNP